MQWVSRAVVLERRRALGAAKRNLGEFTEAPPAEQDEFRNCRRVLDYLSN